MRIYPRHGFGKRARRGVRLLLLDWRRRWSGEGADEKNEPPALIFGQPFLERRHGLSAFADLIEDFAVSDRVHVPGVSDIGRRRIVHHGLGAIAFAVFAVALGALIRVNPPGRL